MPIRPDDFDAVVTAKGEEPPPPQPAVAVAKKPDATVPQNELVTLRSRDRTRGYWQAATIICLVALVSLFRAYSVSQHSLSTAISERDAARRQFIDLQKEIEPGVAIEKVWTEPNVHRGTLTGMMVHLKFAANNLKCEPLQAIASFYLESGEELQSSDSAFSTKSGTLAVWDNFSPDSQHTTWGDEQMFLPYSAFKLPSGHHDIKYSVSIRRRGGDWKSFAQAGSGRLTFTN